MISFDQGTTRFNYRIVGVALNGNRVLLHRAEHENFWSLPGGRCEPLEPATETLKREMREEMGAEVQVERLLWVVENFFELGGKTYHELGLYFLMTFAPDSPLYEKTEFLGNEAFFADKELLLIFQWFPLDALEEIPLYPAFLRQGLRAIPETTQHVVHVDGGLP
jgi:ADP-ribose pyrophosphatase YjhB (NUDIX family)